MKSIDAAKQPQATSHGAELRQDAPAEASTPPKLGLLPTGLSRAIVIGSTLLLIAAVVIGLLGDRYSLNTFTRTENAFAFRIDHLTGRVSFCSPAACVTVPDKVEPNK